MTAVRHTQKGTVLVESAITLLMFFVTLLGIMEAGRFMQVQQTLTTAARMGARLAVAPITQTSTLATIPEIEAAVDRLLDASSVAGGSVTVERPVVISANGIDNEFTRVTVTAPYQVITLSMFADLEVDLTGEALMRNETSP